jgi:hypothetical protein
MAGYGPSLGIDISPDQIDHLFKGYIYAGFVKDLGDATIDLYSGEYDIMDNSILERFHKTPTEEQRTWRKRNKVDELSKKAVAKKLSKDEMALFKSLLTDLYPIEAQGVYGKLANKNRARRKSEWRSIQLSQKMIDL